MLAELLAVRQPHDAVGEAVDVEHLVHEEVGIASEPREFVHSPVSPENTTEPLGVSKR